MYLIASNCGIKKRSISLVHKLQNHSECRPSPGKRNIKRVCNTLNHCLSGDPLSALRDCAPAFAEYASAWNIYIPREESAVIFRKITPRDHFYNPAGGTSFSNLIKFALLEYVDAFYDGVFHTDRNYRFVVWSLAESNRIESSRIAAALATALNSGRANNVERARNRAG